MRKKMRGILWAGEWSQKVMEFKYDSSDDSRVRYGLVAFGKDASKKYVDCMYVLYKIDFRLGTRIVTRTRDHAALFGLVRWSSEVQEVKKSNLGAYSARGLQNLFRVKALEGFQKERLIERINWVDSTDEIEDLQGLEDGRVKEIDVEEFIRVMFPLGRPAIGVDGVDINPLDPTSLPILPPILDFRRITGGF